MTPSSLCTLLPKDVADFVVFGQAGEFGLELVSGALDGAVFVVVAVGEVDVGDGVHGLVSFDAVSECAHFVRPRLTTDILRAFIVEGHAVINSVGCPKGQGQFKSAPDLVFCFLTAPLGDHEEDVGFLFVGERRNATAEFRIVD